MKQGEIVYFKHFWEHILMKQMFEIEKRYFGNIPLATDLYEELRELFENKGGGVVIPFADFSVTSFCTLQCKYCTQWIPYLKKRRLYSYSEVKGWFDQIFRYVDYIHIISPLGGEAFLNPDFAQILKYMLLLQQDGKIGYIRIVTNGTIYPDESLQEVLCDPRILLFVSDYRRVLSDVQEENRRRFIQFLEEHQCRYYTLEPEWIDFGIPEVKQEVDAVEESNFFETCLIKDCVGIYEGNLYHCTRSYALENMGYEIPREDEVIRFAQVKSKEEMRERLRRFYQLESLSACAWCKEPTGRRQILAAEQVEKLDCKNF